MRVFKWSILLSAALWIFTGPQSARGQALKNPNYTNGVQTAGKPIYPYTHAFLVSLNDSIQYPCGFNGTPTDQLGYAFFALITGGVVDATCYQQPFAITYDTFSPYSKPILIWLPDVAITVNANVTIGSNFMLCYGPGSSIAAGAGYTLTNNAQACLGASATAPGAPRYSIQVNNPLGTFAGGDFQNVPGTNLLNSAGGLTTQVIIAGGQDGAETGIIGPLILRGGHQTATTAIGYSGSSGGGVAVEGGDQASASGSSQAGSIELYPGEAPNGGEQGVAIFGQIYKQGTGSVTQWAAECQSLTATMTVSDCGATPGHFVGVADVHTGSIVEVHTPPSVTPFSASAAVTLGHTVCLGAASPLITDSGTVLPCTAGITVGVVVAVTGEWTFADGASSTITTVLPLVNLYKTHAEGPGDLQNFPQNITITVTSGSQGGNSCSTPATATLTGLTTSGTFSNLSVGYTSNPSALTGWGASGGMVFQAWPSAANTVSWVVCNQTATSISYDAITFSLAAK